MEIKAVQSKLLDALKKYKFALLIVLIGIIFLLMPTAKKNVKTSQQTDGKTEVVRVTDEERLADILRKIKGAGEVAVMLTTASGEETIYQTDDQNSMSGDTSSTAADTVTVTDSQRNQNGLIRQVNPARYMGAIIVCGGADDANVRLSIVDAVSKVTGLGANQISVLKMK